MNLVYDSLTKKVDILSKALGSATERTRTMLYVVTFFSILILITAFNAYLSWDRKLNAQERLFLSKELNLIPASYFKPYNYKLAQCLRNFPISKYKNCRDSYVDSFAADIIYDLQNNYHSNTTITDSLDHYISSLRSAQLLLPQSEFFKVYLDRQKFVIPIIGISCYADDVYLIGGLCLLLLLTYSFFSVRRENKIVERISATVEYIYISNPKDYTDNESFTNTGAALVKHNLLETVYFSCTEFFIFNTGLTISDYPSSRDYKEYLSFTNTKTNRSGRLVLQISYYLPFISLLFAFSFEIKSLINRFNFINNNDLIDLSIRYAFVVVFIILIFRQCLIINKLNQKNSKLINEMFEIIQKSREKLGFK
jgi:hypothetical protein